MKAPHGPLAVGARPQCLPNSNHDRSFAISHASEADGNPAGRRAIPVGAVEAAWAAGDGHAIRRIDYPVPAGSARGSVLFLPGRGDFYEKYLEVFAHWHRRGLAVTAVDLRGQGGSGRLGADGVTGHIGDFTQWIDDTEALWRDWAKSSPAPRVLAGHSMGGHVALRAVAEARIAPDALVLVAPMLGLRGKVPPAIMQAAARGMMALGDPRRPAWKWSEKPGEPPASRRHLLTHDADRYDDELWWRRERPEVTMGPGSWKWVERAYASMRLLSAPGVLERVDVPVLILATTADRLVSYDAIAAAARRLPSARLVTFGAEAHHEILREADPVRLRAFGEIDRFLEELGAGR